MSQQWLQVSPNEPCKICGRDSRCTITADGTVAKCCYEADGCFKSTEDDVGPAYYHRLAPDPFYKPQEKHQPKTADPQLVHDVYVVMMRALKLSSEHIEDLKRRGFTQEQIANYGYRTYSYSDLKRLGTLLLDKFGVELYDVPGFSKWSNTGDARLFFPGFVDEQGKWSRVDSVLVVPVRGKNGKLTAMKMRPSDPGWKGPKYVYFNSTRSGGSSASAAVHVPKGMPDNCDTVWITEGEIKADLAFAMTGNPVISIPGVSSYAKAIPVLKQLSAGSVIVALDSDCRSNMDVARTLRKLFRLLINEGFKAGIAHWLPEAGKGLDDVLAAGKQPEVSFGAEAEDVLCEICNEASLEPEPVVHPLEDPLVGSVSTLAAGTRVLCGDRGNIGTVVSDNGADTVMVHFVSPDGNEEHKEILRSDLKYTDGRPVSMGPSKLVIRRSAELVASHPKLRSPIFDGLLRVGEVMNVISAPKFGKSWLILGMALCVASGRKWLDKFSTRRGKVLLCDNELHPETLSDRLPRVAMMLGLEQQDWEDNLDVITLRGNLIDLHGLAAFLMTLEPNSYDLVILDAWYRLQPADSDENSNGDVTALYNLLDAVAHKLGCAFACVHHSSKGNQSEKSVTDVGSGAGAQSRAPDSHLIMRQHEYDNVLVVDASVRSFKPIEAFCLRWEHPVFTVDETLDAKNLRTGKTQRRASSSDKSTEASDGFEDPPKVTRDEAIKKKKADERERLLNALSQCPDGETKRALRDAANMSGERCSEILERLESLGTVERFEGKKLNRKVELYRLTHMGQTGQAGQNSVPLNLSHSENRTGVQSWERDRRDFPPLGGNPVPLSHVPYDASQTLTGTENETVENLSHLFEPFGDEGELFLS